MTSSNFGYHDTPEWEFFNLNYIRFKSEKFGFKCQTQHLTANYLKYGHNLTGTHIWKA